MLRLKRAWHRGEQDQHREEMMPGRNSLIHNALLAATMLATPAVAAEVTPERLVNADSRRTG
jgi:hypothetical protein